jgi:hypothetical protein
MTPSSPRAGYYGAQHPNMRGVDDVLQAMVYWILKQRGQVMTINDFFLYYDAYETRTFESWELEIMFRDVFSPNDADLVVR